MEARRDKTGGLVHDSRPAGHAFKLAEASHQFQYSLQCLVLPRAEPRHWICSKPVTRIKAPAPTVRADALLAVVKLITVVVQSDLSGTQSVPELMMYSSS